MSDAEVLTPGTDARRLLSSVAAALAFHAGLLVLLALVAGLGAPSTREPQTNIDVQIESDFVPAQREPAPSPAAPADAPAAGSAAATVVSAAGSAQGSKAASSAGSGDGSGGFVIPTARTSAAEAAVSQGSSFRESGGKTGVAEKLPAVQAGAARTGTAAAAAAGSNTGAAAAGSGAGSGAAVSQRSGEGVLVPGPAGKGSDAKLDLGQLDRVLAASGSGAAVVAGSGRTGTGGTGTGGTGTGGTGTGGTGTGGTGTGGTGTGSGGVDYLVNWAQPDVSKGRELLAPLRLKIPAWVSKEGLPLRVTLDFTVMPDGVVSTASIEKSSGYADVDAAAVDALRRGLFTATKATLQAKGSISLVIRPQ
jgi:TonB family protein